MNPNPEVKKSSYTESQKRANKKWRAKNIEKSRDLLTCMQIN